MKIMLTKLSDAHHRFEVVRSDGSGERVELDSRSYLLHDLVHYAVEAEARIEDGFFGLLARGVALERLNDSTMQQPLSDDLASTERWVGPLQSLYKQHAKRALDVETVARALPGTPAPTFVAGVFERLRQLTGRWRATRYRDRMELVWPPD